MLRPDDDRLALVEGATGRRWTHAELAAEAAGVAARLAAPAKALAVVRCRIDVQTVVNYLGALAAGHAVALIDDAAPGFEALVERYRPAFVLTPEGEVDHGAPGTSPAPELRVLLSTSGTTGSPKLVRLSEENVRSNAVSIARYLGLGDTERAIASLPFHYSYGLSVLNSHLVSGGAVVLPPESLMRPSFWETFEAEGCTSFAGVPYSYALLERTGWDRRELASLRTMTQAGGRMDPGAVRGVASELRSRGARLFVMYGQTEATARIAYVPPERLAEKPGSIGLPIPGGALGVESGELVYRGPNVMLGYAESDADLARGDDLGGVLRTGDLGHRDEDGFFFVTGRAKRFAKVNGLRVNLEEIESVLRADGPAAVVGHDEQALVVFLQAGSHAPAVDVRRALAARYRLHPRTFEMREVAALPVTTSGKIDYAALAAEAAHAA